MYFYKKKKKKNLRGPSISLALQVSQYDHSFSMQLFYFALPQNTLLYAIHHYIIESMVMMSFLTRLY